jgi:hypothetical protein
MECLAVPVCVTQPSPPRLRVALQELGTAVRRRASASELELAADRCAVAARREALAHDELIVLLKRAVFRACSASELERWPALVTQVVRSAMRRYPELETS